MLGTNVTTNTMTAPDCSALPPSLYPLPSIRGKTIKILSILPLITEAQGPGRDGAMLMLIGDKEDALLWSALNSNDGTICSAAHHLLHPGDIELREVTKWIYPPCDVSFVSTVRCLFVQCCTS